MSASGPPDKWEIITGTWGTDVDRIEATGVAPSNSFSGLYAIRLKNTAVATKIMTPVVSVSGDLYNTGDSSAFIVGAWLKASSTSCTVTVSITSYDAEGTDLGATTVFSGAPPSNSGWFLVSQLFEGVNATARFWQITVAKSTDLVNIDIDSITVNKAPAYFECPLQDDWTLTTDSTWRTVPFVDTVSTFMEHDVDTLTTNAVTILNAGIYCLGATVTSETNLDAGAFLYTRIKIVSTYRSETNYYYGIRALTTNNVSVVSVSGLRLFYGDVVSVQAFSDNGADLTIGGDDLTGSVRDIFTYFHGVRIGR